jgi:hypothetical protein
VELEDGRVAFLGETSTEMFALCLQRGRRRAGEWTLGEYWGLFTILRWGCHTTYGLGFFALLLQVDFQFHDILHFYTIFFSAAPLATVQPPLTEP